MFASGMNVAIVECYTFGLLVVERVSILEMGVSKNVSESKSPLSR